jgi:hypothetical protein
VSDPLEDVLRGLLNEKTRTQKPPMQNRVELTDEMSRRVGLDKTVGRQVLGIELKAAANERRPTDMTNVAWGIKELSTKRSNG